MQKFIKFPSIKQYRDICRAVKTQSDFQGFDEQGEPVYDKNAVKPVITFKGTVKLHGTNAGICFDPVDKDIWFQSRSGILGENRDNAMFYTTMKNHVDTFRTFSEEVYGLFGDSQNETTSVFGEWCGGNIQKGVAINGLQNMFVVFGIKVGETWVNVDMVKSQVSAQLPNNCYFITDFQTYSMDIDFNAPEYHTEKLQELTLKVEDECPVGKHFGVSGVGEGIVWHTIIDGQLYNFKVKGNKHSSSKVKTLVSVSPEKLEGISSFIEYSVTESRFNQAIENVFTMEGKQLDIKLLGSVIKWMKDDIFKEEMDVLKENNLNPQDVLSGISTKTRNMFMEVYKNEIYN